MAIKRNLAAKALHTDQYRSKVVKSKKVYSRKNVTKKEKSGDIFILSLAFLSI